MHLAAGVLEATGCRAAFECGAPCGEPAALASPRCVVLLLSLCARLLVCSLSRCVEGGRSSLGAAPAERERKAWWIVDSAAVVRALKGCRCSLLVASPPPRLASRVSFLLALYLVAAAVGCAGAAQRVLPFGFLSLLTLLFSLLFPLASIQVTSATPHTREQQHTHERTNSTHDTWRALLTWQTLQPPSTTQPQRHSESIHRPRHSSHSSQRCCRGQEECMCLSRA